MGKRHFLQLCHTYSSSKHRVNGWYWSEKLDGERCFWDGGQSRGKSVRDCPWANFAKSGWNDTCTGLWSRYAKVIHAPSWWLDRLPQGIALDGELYMGRGLFNSLRSITGRTVNVLDSEWEEVCFYVFDIPSTLVFSNGTIDVANHYATFNNIPFERWNYWNFERNYIYLKKELPESETLRLHKHERLPLTNCDLFIDTRLNEITDGGGEGIVLRKPEAIWAPERVHNVLKVKAFADTEATVIGFCGGENRHLGSVGSLICKLNGFQFNLGTGLADVDRVTDGTCLMPNKEYYSDVSAVFAIGEQVTFRYRELRNGVPIEARYLRKYM